MKELLRAAAPTRIMFVCVSIGLFLLRIAASAAGENQRGRASHTLTNKTSWSPVVISCQHPGQAVLAATATLGQER
jgi:hypothetical protein